MPVYMILAPNNSTLEDSDIEGLFEHRIQLRPDVSWMVMTPIPTCSEVRDRIRAEHPGRTCVIVKAKEYNGYAKRDIWEKLEAWEQADAAR